MKLRRSEKRSVGLYVRRRPGKREKDVEHLEMDRFVATSYFISSVVVFTALIYIPQGSANECRPPLIKTISAEIGDEISILGQLSLGSEYHGEDLIWKKYGRDSITICYANQMKNYDDDRYTFNCDNMLTLEFHVDIGTCQILCCTLNIFTANALHSDSGIYLLQTTGPDNRFLMVVNITVIETKQTCSATHPKDSEYLQMTCQWVPQANYESASFSHNEETRYNYENHLPVKNELIKNIPLGDALCEDKAPNTCTIRQSGSEKSCELLTRLHVANFRDNHATNVSFRFCASNRSDSSLWMYDRNSIPLLVNITGQIIRSKSNINSCNNNQIIIVWGEEKSEELIFSGIGKIVMDPNLQFNLKFSLPKLINHETALHGRSENNEQCLNEFSINILAHPLFNNTSDDFETTEVSIFKTGRDGKSCVSSNDTVLLNNRTSIFDHQNALNMLRFSLVTSILTLLVISAMCLMCLKKKGRLILKCRNICIRHELQSGTASQDEQNARPNDDHESIQMTRFPSSPSNLTRDAINDGATGPKENVYSSVDDLPMLARGSGDAYTEVKSEMCPLQPRTPSCGQLELNDTLPGSEYELVRDLKHNDNDLTLTEAEQENYPECSFAIPHQIQRTPYDRLSSSTPINGNRRLITSYSTNQERYPGSSRNDEQNDRAKMSEYDTLNLLEVNETRRNLAVHISTSISPSSSTTRASSSDLTSNVSTCMMSLTDPSTLDYDNLRRPDVEDYIGN